MSGPAVGYLTKRFPRLSETFILDEILGLERAGVPLRLFALGDPHEARIQPDVMLVRSPVTYLRGTGGWRSSLAAAGATIAAHGRLALTRPGRYARTVVYILRKRRHATTIRHFVEAGLLARMLEREGARHLHAAFAHGPASVAHFVHLLTGLPFSFAAHAKDLYRSAPDLLARKVAAASFVLACSESAAADLRAIAGPAASRVILAPHGVNLERFAPARRRQPVAMGAGDPGPSGLGGTRGDGRAALRLLAVGRLVEKKGYATLLDALARVHATGRPVRCEVIGGGAERTRIEARIAQIGLGDVVRLRGARTHDEVARAYAGADAFVQASVVLPDGDRDGIPNSLLEAMASGLAVAATSVGGIPEVVIDGATGLLVRPEDPEALAEAICRLADDASLRRRLGAGARDHVLRHLDRARMVRAIAPLFLGAGGESVSGGAPPGAGDTPRHRPASARGG